MVKETGGNAGQPRLLRRFGLLQASALNMANMVGVGPFITIPLLMSALGGPQSILGWLVGFIITLSDGLVWSEFGAAFPGSGGSYIYLREAFGPERLGRLMAFLFIWQFIISGPLELASGYIGFAKYLSYIWRGMTPLEARLVCAAVGVTAIILLYRRITSIGKLTVVLWAGTIITVLSVIASGAARFDPKVAFDFPPGAFSFSLGFLLGLGAAARVGIYDYLGYYDICYIGEEVRNPGRVIPRSILISLSVIVVLYLCMNLSIIGVVPWREFVPAADHQASNFIVSIFMERIHGPGIAVVFTVLVLWTTFGSVFALLLGYSRIPYAAALDGGFFRVFARLHPKKNFPHISLLAVGVLSIVSSFFSLGLVIEALVTMRILIQFIGQIAGLIRLRRIAPNLNRPYRMWLYPLPALVALVGWIFVFVTADRRVLLFGLATLAAGVAVFLGWTKRAGRWPFSRLEKGQSA
jgi:APA family basic amino acid/polyamine antiporter